MELGSANDNECGFFKKVNPLCGVFESLILTSGRMAPRFSMVVWARLKSTCKAKSDKITHLQKHFLKGNREFSENLFVHFPCPVD